MQRKPVQSLLRLGGKLRCGWAWSSEAHGTCRTYSANATSSGEVGAISGVPTEVFQRKVVIYSPARTPSQQGMAKTVGKQNKSLPWKLEFNTEQKWENPLIGWTSTADPLEHVARSSMAFGTKEDAASFCDKQGWKYEIREPHLRRTTRQKRFFGYGDNYSVKRNGIPDGGLISEGTAAPFKKKSTGL